MVGIKTDGVISARVDFETKTTDNSYKTQRHVWNRDNNGNITSLAYIFNENHPVKKEECGYSADRSQIPLTEHKIEFFTESLSPEDMVALLEDPKAPKKLGFLIKGFDICDKDSPKRHNVVTFMPIDEVIQNSKFTSIVKNKLLFTRLDFHPDTYACCIMNEEGSIAKIMVYDNIKYPKISAIGLASFNLDNKDNHIIGGSNSAIPTNFKIDKLPDNVKITAFDFKFLTSLRSIFDKVVNEQIQNLPISPKQNNNKENSKTNSHFSTPILTSSSLSNTTKKLNYDQLREKKDLTYDELTQLREMEYQIGLAKRIKDAEKCTLV